MRALRSSATGLLTAQAAAGDLLYDQHRQICLCGTELVEFSPILNSFKIHIEITEPEPSTAR